MTQTEYQKAYSNARARAPRLTREAMQKLQRTYQDAAQMASRAVRNAEKRGLSEITAASRQAINEQLEEGARIIRENVEDQVPATVRRGAASISSIDTEYMIDAVEDAGVTETITATGIRGIAQRVNDQVASLVTARIWEDGLTFSERVWRVGQDYGTQMRRVLSAGLAQGRDVLDIAEDMNQYVAEGKQRLIQRFGPNLESGTSRFLRRVRQRVDYRSLRLVRTELYAGLQEAGRQSGRANPASTGEYDWILNAARQQWGCSCPDLAAGGPYRYQDVPGIPHPNCQCRVQSRLQDRRKFQSDLKAWVNGESRPNIQEWYQQFYRQAA